ASLDAPERRAGYPAACDQVARDDAERLALSRDAAHGREPPAHPRGLYRLAHYVDVAGRLERVVGAEAVGQVEDLLHDVGPALDRVGGTLSPREPEPLLGEVDADDSLRTLEPAAGDRAEAHHAGAEDRTGAARRDLGGVDRRSEPGREAAGEQARAVEGRVLV